MALPTREQVAALLSKYYDDGCWRCAVCGYLRRDPLNHAPQCPIPTLLAAADARLDLQAELDACRHEANVVLETENAELKAALEAKEPPVETLWAMLRVWGEEAHRRKMKLRDLAAAAQAVVNRFNRLAWELKGVEDYLCPSCDNIAPNHDARGCPLNALEAVLHAQVEKK